MLTLLKFNLGENVQMPSVTEVVWACGHCLFFFAFCFFSDLFFISNLGDLCSVCQRHCCAVLIWRQTLKECVSNTRENLSYCCTKNWGLVSMSSLSTALIYNGWEGKNKRPGYITERWRHWIILCSWIKSLKEPLL